MVSFQAIRINKCLLMLILFELAEPVTPIPVHEFVSKDQSKGLTNFQQNNQNRGKSLKRSHNFSQTLNSSYESSEQNNLSTLNLREHRKKWADKHKKKKEPYSNNTRKKGNNQAQIDTLKSWIEKRKPEKKLSNVKKLVMITTPKTTTTTKKRSSIRKIYTKWTDEGKLDDIFDPVLDGYEDISDETKYSNVEHNIKVTLNSDETETYKPIQPINKIFLNIPASADDTNMYSSHSASIDEGVPAPKPIVTYGSHSSSLNNKDQTLFNKPKWPIIQKWPPLNQEYETTIQDEWKPSVSDKPQESDEFEHVTEESFSSYTDRIVIRPDEVLGVSEDCPTIYLTLNNTVKAQGKEACPDLNIAVNTNVVNKNVVVQDSEAQEENNGIDVLAVPTLEDAALEDDSIEVINQYYDILSGETVDGSLETLSAEGDKEIETAGAEPAGTYSAAAPPDAPGINVEPSRPSRPSRPNKHKNKHKDENEEQDSLSDWLTPASTIMSWLSALNPLHFGVFSMILAPLALLFAGSSGVAAIVAPWAIPYARQAPKIIHVYRPSWSWDPHHHSWNWHSYLHNRKWVEPRSSENFDSNSDENGTLTFSNWFGKNLGETLKLFSDGLKKYSNIVNKKHLRRKRTLRNFKFR